jgi:mannose-binding lectin 2
MAIWLTKDRAEPGPVFGSKGQFLGIFVLTHLDLTLSLPRQLRRARYLLGHVSCETVIFHIALLTCDASYANSRHPYGFPRILAMMGDGQTPYDQGHDGEANSLGSCQAAFRRTNVITKLKITFMRDSYLDVRLDPCAFIAPSLTHS